MVGINFLHQHVIGVHIVSSTLCWRWLFVTAATLVSAHSINSTLASLCLHRRHVDAHIAPGRSRRASTRPRSVGVPDRHLRHFGVTQHAGVTRVRFVYTRRSCRRARLCTDCSLMSLPMHPPTQILPFNWQRNMAFSQGSVASRAWCACASEGSS